VGYNGVVVRTPPHLAQTQRTVRINEVVSFLYAKKKQSTYYLLIRTASNWKAWLFNGVDTTVHAIHALVDDTKLSISDCLQNVKLLLNPRRVDLPQGQLWRQWPVDARVFQHVHQCCHLMMWSTANTIISHGSHTLSNMNQEQTLCCNNNFVLFHQPGFCTVTAHKWHNVLSLLDLCSSFICNAMQVRYMLWLFVFYPETFHRIVIFSHFDRTPDFCQEFYQNG